MHGFTRVDLIGEEWLRAGKYPITFRAIVGQFALGISDVDSVYWALLAMLAAILVSRLAAT